MLNVIDTESRHQIATINYAFEPPQPPFEDEEQMFLDPLNPQSDLSDRFLDPFADMIGHDRAYHDRLVRHYEMWKRAIGDPEYSGHEKIRTAVNCYGIFPPEPARRSGPKIGPNDPCPRGSGRKFKRCCRI
jgi:hypothetical protein